MWECGVALGPDTENTNLVVFECAKETPKVFRPNVRVRVNQDEIKVSIRSSHLNSIIPLWHRFVVP